jgi:hypothetical protein
MAAPTFNAVSTVETDEFYADGVPARRLKCPACECTYMHSRSPFEIHNDEYRAWDGRGRVTAIPFRCEEGDHLHYLCVGHHKGESFLFWAPPPGEVG